MVLAKLINQITVGTSKTQLQFLNILKIKVGVNLLAMENLMCLKFMI